MKETDNELKPLSVRELLRRVWEAEQEPPEEVAARKEISERARRAVLERDSIDGCPCCIYCGRPLMSGAHLHHVKRRSQGGAGIEENLVTLCWKCHHDLHDGYMDIQRFCNSYLEERYADNCDN